MIITININPFKNKIKDLDFFKDYIKICIRKINKLLKCKITPNQINILNVPVNYVDFIKKTIDVLLNSDTFWSDYNSYVFESSLDSKEFKLIDLFFDMFNLKPKQQSKIFKKIDNLQIGYNEDLYFFTKKKINSNDVIETRIADNTYFYKIQHNSDIHKDSSIKIFNNLKLDDYKIINKPSNMYSFQIIVDEDIDSFSELLYIYDKNEVYKYSNMILDNYKKFSTTIKLSGPISNNNANKTKALTDFSKLRFSSNKTS